MKMHYNKVRVIENLTKILNCYSFFLFSKDKTIKLNDIRLKKADVETFERHKGQICGMSTQNQYLASGGNDNRVFIWDIRKSYSVA